MNSPKHSDYSLYFVLLIALVLVILSMCIAAGQVGPPR